MTHERKKLSKITEELMLFFYGIGGNDITFNVKLKGDDAVITFESNFDPKHRHAVEDMDRLLHSGHDYGVEDIYWELMGSGEPGETSQLLLVGMLVDKVDVTVNDDRVKVVMYKKDLHK
ncbi:MAG: hypothetical protein IJN37_09880 [Clostridia bacterium]|nr:hypothetical protein [Oscillospiraceae bacterium]MBQ6934681.1 hypothetical protein [Clostridia bacterium]